MSGKKLTGSISDLISCVSDFMNIIVYGKARRIVGTPEKNMLINLMENMKEITDGTQNWQQTWRWYSSD